MATRASTLRVTPLTPSFAAEVGGVDVTKPVDDETFAEIRGAFEEYSVLVLHDQPLDDDAQIVPLPPRVAGPRPRDLGQPLRAPPGHPVRHDPLQAPDAADDGLGGSDRVRARPRLNECRLALATRRGLVVVAMHRIRILPGDKVTRTT
jgi:alpha-ketoglutarate-dependent taurine dioxygenase